MKYYSYWIVVVLILISLFGILGCTKEAPIEPVSDEYEYQVPVTTNDGWETASLNSVGMDEGPIVNLVNTINNDVYTEVHSVIIIKENKLVFEEYWPGHDFGYTSPNFLGTPIDFDMNTRHNTHSATKSFTSAVVGIAIDEGFMQSEKELIFEYLDEYYDTWKNEGRENITIENCLMMASGLEWNEWDVPVSSSQMDMVRFNQSSDPVAYLLNKPLVSIPGARFYYNGGTVDLLGVLVANATGQSVKKFSRDHLFQRLGITNYNWQTLYPSGITCCHGDIYITPRDMAKIGSLFLNDGVWNGVRLISSEWVQESTRFHISPGVTWADGYGYLWWLRNFSVNGEMVQSFKAMGWGGQEIFIFNSLNLVIVFTGANYVTDPPCDNIVRNYILPAIQ